MSGATKRTLNRALFEAAALPYDLLTRHPVWRAHCREMLSHLPPAGDRRLVLDLGCGPGVSAIEMKRASPGDDFVGIDLSGAMLRRALIHRRKAGMDETLPLLQADVCALPLADACADGLTGHSFLYLVHDPVAALAEMRRVLRPGGAVVLLEPAEGNGMKALWAMRGTPGFALTMSIWRVVSGAEGRFTAATLAAILGRAGFAHITVEPTLGGLGLLARAVRP